MPKVPRLAAHVSVYLLPQGEKFVLTPSWDVVRKQWFDNMEIVQRGDDPMATVRDVSKNEPMIDIPRERRSHQAFFTFDGVYRAPARPGARG